MAKYQIIDVDVGVTHTVRDTSSNVAAFREIVEGMRLDGRVYEVTDAMLADCDGDHEQAEKTAVQEMVYDDARAAFVAKYPQGDIGGCMVEVHYLESKIA